MTETALEKLERLRRELPNMPREKPPRAYASEICQLPTREARAAAIEEVPADCRHIVRFYVASYFARRARRSLPELKPEASV